MSRRSKTHRIVDDSWTPLEEAISKDILKAEVRAWCQRIGVELKELHVRPMTRKWGSCSTAGRMTVNSELLTKPAELRREVIVHELVHLKVPNHGKLFRVLVRAYLGQEERRDEIG